MTSYLHCAVKVQLLVAAETCGKCLDEGSDSAGHGQGERIGNDTIDLRSEQNIHGHDMRAVPMLCLLRLAACGIADDLLTGSVQGGWMEGGNMRASMTSTIPF